MDKSNLVEIKKGEIGTGLLIEHDGYISCECGDNKKLFESYNNTKDGEDYCPFPFIVSAVFQKFDKENANGRIYPESILKREVDKYMTKLREKWAYGECNHPAESTIDLSRVAINIVELHWEGKTLVGKLEIITSPGFRKYGIISCQGDQVANLILQGLKVGVSSRGLGTVTQRMGKLVVGEDFELVCWDVVSDPSTPNAFITPEDAIPELYIESKDNSTKNGKKLIEELKGFDEWLNK